MSLYVVGPVDELPGGPKHRADDSIPASKRPCGGCFVPGTLVHLAALPAAVAVVSGGAFDPIEPRTTVAIEEVPLGSRIAEKNPRPEDYDFTFGQVDERTWRQVDLELRRDDGALVEMQLLRPEQWLLRNGISVGGRFNVQLAEMGVNAPATVKAIRPCGVLSPGEGNVVTGRFVTRSVSNLVRVELENGAEFVGTTTHPVWLPAVGEWRRLDELQPGDLLDTIDGRRAVLRTERESATSDVYNIEVHGEHVYRIAGDGVLVHNASTDCGSIPDAPKRTDLHHTIPREIRKSRRTGESLLPDHLVEHPDIVGKPGNPNRWPVDHDLHVDIHKRNRPGGDYNTRWKEELADLEELKPRNEWTADDILEIRDRLTGEFGIDGFRP